MAADRPDLPPPQTRDQARSRRAREVKPASIRNKARRRELRLIRQNPTPPNEGRPKTRGECAGTERPCAYVSCRFHLYLDVNPATGTIKINFPDLEVSELRESCALDVSDRGETTVEDVGALLNVTRERIRQIEEVVLRRLALHGFEQLRDYADEGEYGRRRLPVVQEGDEERPSGRAFSGEGFHGGKSA